MLLKSQVQYYATLANIVSLNESILPSIQFLYIRKKHVSINSFDAWHSGRLLRNHVLHMFLQLVASQILSFAYYIKLGNSQLLELLLYSSDNLLTSKSILNINMNKYYKLMLWNTFIFILNRIILVTLMVP